MKRIVILLCLFSWAKAKAATINCANCEYVTVSNAVASSVAGDVVRIPAGTCRWTNGILTITKRIWLEGAGMDQTILERGTNDQTMIFFSNIGIGTMTNICGVRHLTVRANDNNVAASGLIVMGGAFAQTNGHWRVHNVKCDDIRRRGIASLGENTGLIDHCWFVAKSNLSCQGVTIQGAQRAGSGGEAITNKSGHVVQFGIMSGFVYVEDCVFDFRWDNDGANDIYWDGREVFRYNIVTNSNYMSSHDATGNRHATVWEYYGNLMVNTATSSFSENGFIAVGDLRTGVGVVWSNTAIGQISTPIYNPRLTSYRTSGTNVFAFWYPATLVNGTNRWDGSFGEQNLTAPCLGYPGLDMIGWSDPVTWTATNSSQTFYGMYAWGNRAGTNFNSLTNTPAFVRLFGSTSVEATNAGLTGWNGIRLPHGQELIVEGRDFFNYIKPDYTPLVYPHPFVTASLPSYTSTRQGNFKWRGNFKR